MNGLTIRSIKELRAVAAELRKRVAAVCGLNTALRNENAKLRREIERLKGSAAVASHGKQKAKGRTPAKGRSAEA